jgi:uncharacterized membrane protein
MDNLPKKDSNTPKRITWNLIWSDFLNVINFEKGVFFSIKGLILKPKETVDDFLYGNRGIHANPIRFLLFSTAVITLLNFYLIIQPNLEKGTFTQTENGSFYDLGKQMGGKAVSLEFTENEEVTKNENQDNSNPNEQAEVTKIKDEKLSKKDQQRVVKESMDKLFSWMDKLTFAMVPIFAIFTFLFFRKTSYNFTENLAINAFMISITNVLGIVFIIPSYFFPMIGGAILTSVTTIYMIVFIYKVFANKGFGGLFKSVVTMIISYFVFLILMGSALIYFVFDSI